MREFRVVVKSMSFGAIQMQVQIPAVSLTIVTYNSLTGVNLSVFISLNLSFLKSILGFEIATSCLVVRVKLNKYK